MPAVQHRQARAADSATRVNRRGGQKAPVHSRESVSAAIALVRARQQVATATTSNNNSGHVRVSDVRELKQFRSSNDNDNYIHSNNNGSGNDNNNNSHFNNDEQSFRSMASTLSTTPTMKSAAQAGSSAAKARLVVSTSRHQFSTRREKLSPRNHQAARSPLAPKAQASPKAMKDTANGTTTNSRGKIPSGSPTALETAARKTPKSGSFFTDAFASRSQTRESLEQSGLPTAPSGSFEKDQENERSRTSSITSRSDFGRTYGSVGQFSNGFSVDKVEQVRRERSLPSSHAPSTTKKSVVSSSGIGYRAQPVGRPRPMYTAKKPASPAKPSLGLSQSNTSKVSAIPSGPSFDDSSDDGPVVDSKTLQDVSKFIDNLGLSKRRSPSPPGINNTESVDPIEALRQNQSICSLDDETSVGDLNPETVAEVNAFIDKLASASSGSSFRFGNDDSDDDETSIADVPEEAKADILAFIDSLQKGMGSNGNKAGIAAIQRVNDVMAKAQMQQREKQKQERQQITQPQQQQQHSTTTGSQKKEIQTQERQQITQPQQQQQQSTQPQQQQQQSTTAGSQKKEIQTQERQQIIQPQPQQQQQQSTTVGSQKKEIPIIPASPSLEIELYERSELTLIKEDAPTGPISPTQSMVQPVMSDDSEPIYVRTSKESKSFASKDPPMDHTADDRLKEDPPGPSDWADAVLRMRQATVAPSYSAESLQASSDEGITSPPGQSSTGQIPRDRSPVRISRRSSMDDDPELVTIHEKAHGGGDDDDVDDNNSVYYGGESRELLNKTPDIMPDPSGDMRGYVPRPTLEPEEIAPINLAASVESIEYVLEEDDMERSMTPDKAIEEEPAQDDNDDDDAEIVNSKSRQFQDPTDEDIIANTVEENDSDEEEDDEEAKDVNLLDRELPVTVDTTETNIKEYVETAKPSAKEATTEDSTALEKTYECIDLSMIDVDDMDGPIATATATSDGNHIENSAIDDDHIDIIDVVDAEILKISNMDMDQYGDEKDLGYDKEFVCTPRRGRKKSLSPPFPEMQAQPESTGGKSPRSASPNETKVNNEEDPNSSVEIELGDAAESTGSTGHPVESIMSVWREFTGATEILDQPTKDGDEIREAVAKVKEPEVNDTNDDDNSKIDVQTLVVVEEEEKEIKDNDKEAKDDGDEEKDEMLAVVEAVAEVEIPEEHEEAMVAEVVEEVVEKSVSSEEKVLGSDDNKMDNDIEKEQQMLVRDGVVTKENSNEIDIEDDVVAFREKPSVETDTTNGTPNEEIKWLVPSHEEHQEDEEECAITEPSSSNHSSDDVLQNNQANSQESMEAQADAQDEAQHQESVVDNVESDDFDDELIDRAIDQLLEDDEEPELENASSNITKKEGSNDINKNNNNNDNIKNDDANRSSSGRSSQKPTPSQDVTERVTNRKLQLSHNDEGNSDSEVEAILEANSSSVIGSTTSSYDDNSSSVFCETQSSTTELPQFLSNDSSEILPIPTSDSCSEVGVGERYAALQEANESDRHNVCDDVVVVDEGEGVELSFFSNEYTAKSNNKYASIEHAPQDGFKSSLTLEEEEIEAGIADAIATITTSNEDEQELSLVDYEREVNTMSSTDSIPYGATTTSSDALDVERYVTNIQTQTSASTGSSSPTPTDDSRVVTRIVAADTEDIEVHTDNEQQPSKDRYNNSSSKNKNKMVEKQHEQKQPEEISPKARTTMLDVKMGGKDRRPPNNTSFGKPKWMDSDDFVENMRSGSGCNRTPNYTGSLLDGASEGMSVPTEATTSDENFVKASITTNDTGTEAGSSSNAFRNKPSLLDQPSGVEDSFSVREASSSSRKNTTTPEPQQQEQQQLQMTKASPPAPSRTDQEQEKPQVQKKIVPNSEEDFIDSFLKGSLTSGEHQEESTGGEEDTSQLEDALAKVVSSTFSGEMGFNVEGINNGEDSDDGPTSDENGGGFLEQFESLDVDDETDDGSGRHLRGHPSTSSDFPKGSSCSIADDNENAGKKKSAIESSILQSKAEIAKYFATLKSKDGASEAEVKNLNRFHNLVAPVIKGAIPSIIEAAQIRQAAQRAKVSLVVVDRFLELAEDDANKKLDLAESKSEEWKAAIDLEDMEEVDDTQAISEFLHRLESNENSVEVDAKEGFIDKKLGVLVMDEDEEPWWEGISTDKEDRSTTRSATTRETLSKDGKRRGGGDKWDESSTDGSSHGSTTLGDTTNTDSHDHTSYDGESHSDVSRNDKKFASRQRKSQTAPLDDGVTPKMKGSTLQRSFFFGGGSNSSNNAKHVIVNNSSTENDSGVWLRKNAMATYGTGWEKHKKWLSPKPMPIDGVAAADNLVKFASRKNKTAGLSCPWKLTYRERTKAHNGYFNVDVFSIYETSAVNNNFVHPMDFMPWENREVKQLFLHEQSIGFSRNWFGDLVRARGNIKYKPPVCHPKSMEMPIENIPDPGEWTEEWYTAWKAQPHDRPNHSRRRGGGGSLSTGLSHTDNENTTDGGSYTDGGSTSYRGSTTDRGSITDRDDSITRGSYTDNSKSVSSRGGSYTDDEVSWEEAPECGTMVNIKQKIGERVSRVHPDFTSSLRRSRWRKKYFPPGSFPYK